MRAGAEAAMREVIGKSNLQYAQTEGRSRIEQDTKDLLQRILDEYGLGVQHRPGPAAAGRSAAGGDRAPSATCRRRAPTRRRTSTRPTPTVTRCCRAPRAKRKAIIQQRRGLQGRERWPAPSGDIQRFDQVYDQYAKAKDITTRAPLHRRDRRGAAQREQGADRQELRRAASCPTCRCLSCAPARRPRCRRDRVAPPAAGATR